MAWWQSVSIIIGVLAGATTLALKWGDWIKPCLDKRKKRRKQCADHEEKLIRIEDDVIEIKDNLTCLKSSVEEGQRESKSYRRMSLQNKILERHEMYSSQGYITSYQLANFMQCVEQYLKCIDDACRETDPVLSIYLPRIKKLEVRKEI